MLKSRRQFIKSSLATTALTTLPFPYIQQALAQARSTGRTASDSPIQIISDNERFSTDFNGDDIDRVHEVLWNIDGLIQSRGGRPPVTEETQVVVIGGGLAGLTAAYQLRELKPIVLEQDPRFGGNAKGEKYQDALYTIGSTYITIPQEGSEIYDFLNELGLLDLARIESADETTVHFNNRFIKNFWKGSTDSEARAQFIKIHQHLKDIYESGLTDPIFEGGHFSSQFKELDRMTFDQWIEKNYGSVHPHIVEYFQLYAWSSFLASLDEVSAAQMLSFISAETSGIMVFPGGNSAIAQRLYQNLKKDLGASRLRSGCITVDVRLTKDGVEVCYDDPSGKLKTLKAKKCIFAAPKFIARRVIPELSAEQSRAMSEVSYRAYVVANILLDRPIQTNNFELYVLSGNPPPSPTAMRPPQRSVTDLCFATWAQSDRTQHGVLSIYQGLPYDGARQFLFNPASHEKFKTRLLNDAEPILASMGLSSKNIYGLRMTRWGHALPVAMNGFISSGAAERAHRNIEDKIYFANQDNWANPCFESCFAEASLAADKIRDSLKLI